jgi:putative ABC transport system ATP-binding protein
MLEHSSPALEIQNVSKSYGQNAVLKSLDLHINWGERVALMGPSGSGKSTLLNCCSGIDTVDSGEIRVAGNLLNEMSQKELESIRRCNIGYVFQQFNLLPTLTAFENIELPAQLIGMPKEERMERVKLLLKQVGLEHRSTHTPGTLSGGEKQRVAVARALVHQPSLILADEPTGSLDSHAGEQVLDLLESLSRENNTALLLVTHDHASTRICHRVLKMKDGTIIS